MLKYCFLFLLINFYIPRLQAQHIPKEVRETTQDSVKKEAILKQLGNRYISTKYFSLDLRYLAKYNKFEGVRTSVGGITNTNFSKRYHVKSYIAYGFDDEDFKHSVSFSFKAAKKTNTWLNFSYTEDLEESGTTTFLTDKRIFQLSQPRLLNINLFHKHITKSITLEHQLSPNLLTETELGINYINPTYDYGYVLNENILNTFKTSTSKIAVQWSPFSIFKSSNDGTLKEIKAGYPKFAFQYTKSFKNIFKSDLNFYKINFRAIHKIGSEEKGLSVITLVSGIAQGNTPLTHLYHTYPNNLNRDKIFKRYSIAGLNSFETMYFNEFFSDKFTMLQLKHALKPFNISQRYKPQLVLISRHAIGDIETPEKHQNVTFSSLKKGYSESGFEINKLIFGFGLSFTYRYGAYHLPELDDNLAFKFTFNVTL